MENVELATTEELINELKKRHDAMIIAMVKYVDIRGNYITASGWKGNNIVGCGLAELIKSKLIQAETNNSTTIDLREI